MRHGTSIFLAFAVAIFCMFAILSGQLDFIQVFLLADKSLVFAIAAILTIIFNKKILRGIKTINRYSWLIIICFLSGTLPMELMTYKSSVPFEGFLIMLPLVLALIYWSQKNTRLLSFDKSGTSRMDRFQIDLFLITTSFILTGFLSLLTGLNNVDFRGFWPFLIGYLGVFGFVFALLFSMVGLSFDAGHKRYTQAFSMVIIVIYIAICLMPKYSYFSNSIKIEPFYMIYGLLIIIHVLGSLVCRLKARSIKIKVQA